MGNQGLFFSVVYQREHEWIAMKVKIYDSFIPKSPILESCLPKDSWDAEKATCAMISKARKQN